MAVGFEPLAGVLNVQVADSAFPLMPNLPRFPPTIARYCTPDNKVPFVRRSVHIVRILLRVAATVSQRTVVRLPVERRSRFSSCAT